jgi:deoxycytidylate deaminase
MKEETEFKDVETDATLVAPDDAISSPELIIGLVGPIGVDLEAVTTCLGEQLHRVGYKHKVIRVSDIMRFDAADGDRSQTGYVERIKSLIQYANQFCEQHKSNAALAALAISAIRGARQSITGRGTEPAPKTAYIIWQLKRSEEIYVLRKTYGRKFVQVSVYLSEEKRIKKIAEKIRRGDPCGSSVTVYEQEAKNLVRQDFDEREIEAGQRVSDIFHLGDAFVYGDDEEKIERTVTRFIQALFGNNSISPNKDEYGLYLAAAASLRSADLSRQVGAAIFTKSGEIISLGSNEVPKATGGTYWSDSGHAIYRDVECGIDANFMRKREILADTLTRLQKLGLLNIAEDELSSIVANILDEGEIKNSQLMDIIEFGRMMHAEMSAIVDAARLGRSIKDATLYCTTFPCHMCAKHIVGSGISRVVFLEPYPKSYAEDLHNDSITIEEEAGEKVVFQPFIGISPRRYRDIFEKSKRKNGKGEAQKWYASEPTPMIEDRSASYIRNESSAIAAHLNPTLLEPKPNNRKTRRVVSSGGRRTGTKAVAAPRKATPTPSVA